MEYVNRGISKNEEREVKHMKKKVEYEIVKVEKTIEEDDLEKAIAEFREMCNIYEKLMGEKDKVQAQETIRERTIDLIKVIRSMTAAMKGMARKEFTDMNLKEL